MAEQVLVSVEPVRHLKKEGAVVLTSTRLAFQPAGSDHFDHSFNLSSIKQQRVSPDAKTKIQLQIILNDDKCYNFQFANKDNALALRDRNKIRDELQHLLATQKKKMTKDFETKNKLLRGDFRLLQLYKDLVARRIITPEDFWEKYGDKALEETLKSQQSIGVNPSFLSDVQPQIDAPTGSVKYRLTNETISAIFTTYPSVKRKYDQSVPGTLSENEFWSKFFQSHYFYRDRKVADKDPFIDCIKHDDNLLQASAQRTLDDPGIDMRQMTDEFPAEEEGYGIARKTGTSSNTSAQPAETAAQRQKKTVEPSELVKRFNQHSLLILRQLERNHSALGATLNDAVRVRAPVNASSADANSKAVTANNANINSKRRRDEDSDSETDARESGDVIIISDNSDNTNASDSNQPAGAKTADAVIDEDMPLPPDAATASRIAGSSEDVDISGINLLQHASKRRKLAEMVRYEDLEAEQTRRRTTLDLSKSEQQYKMCPPTSSGQLQQQQQHQSNGVAAGTAPPYAQQLRLANIGVKCISDLSRWRNEEQQTKWREIPSGLLGEITQSKQYDFIGTGTDINMFPKDAREMLRDTYASLAEVLRHFWSCFPVLSEQSAEKLERLHTSLDKLCHEILPPLREKLNKINSSSAEVMNHMDEMVRVARAKYEIYKKKPISTRRSLYGSNEGSRQSTTGR